MGTVVILPAYTIPIRLGDVTVGWTTADLARRLSQAPTPHLFIMPLSLEVLALRTHKRFVLVPQASITYLMSLEGVTTAHTDTGRYWTDQTLSAIERRLDPCRFLRLDASHLINITRIAELIQWTHQRLPARVRRRGFDLRWR